MRGDHYASGEDAVRIVESITDDFFALDREFRFTYVNRNAERFFQRSRHDLIGRTFWDVFPTAIGTEFERAYQQAMNERVPLTFEAPSTLSPGTWLEVRTYPSDDGITVYARDVTERKRAEEELRRQKIRFENLFESAPEAIAIVDQEDRILRANTEFGRLFGYARADVIGRTIRDLVVPEAEREASLELTRRTARERQRISTEAVRLRSDGTPIHVSILTVPFREEESEEPLAYGIYRDITERKEADRRLRENEERLRVLVRQMPAVVWTVDRDLRFTMSRGGALEAIGLGEGEVLGLPLAEFFGTDDPDHPPIAAHRAALDGLPRGFEYAYRGRTFQAHVEPLRDEAGEITGVIGVALDVTDRQEIERALRESEEKFRVLVEAAMDGIFIESVEGRILDCNEAGCRMFGYTKDELLGLTIADLVPRSSAEALPDVITEVTGDEAVERVNRRKDGTHFPTEVVTKFVDVGGERRVIAYVRDISARKELEEQLRQSQKMDAVGRLAGGIAHDFNNLMMTVSGYTRFLIEDTPEDSPAREDLAEIERAAERATELTRQLLAFGRKQVLNPTVIDVNAVVRELESMIRRVIGADIEVRAELDPDAPPIEADAGQIEQVIMNLVLNARDAMPDGGTLAIRTECVEIAAEDRPRHIGRTVPRGVYTTLTVSDTGRGIDDETRERIFEPFFTTKDKGKGTGLGLSTVYGIVRQSGGHIQVDSEYGAGTAFRIYFPRADELIETPAAAAAAAAADRVGGLEGRETVLVVEDEASVRRVVRRALDRYGYTVLEAVDGEDALRIARERDGDLDLVLTDLVMPRMGGHELQRRLDDDGVDAPVIFMTGYSRDAVDRSDGLDGAHELVSKPVDPDRLVRKVRDALDAVRLA
ncbi:MAG: PAS domain S-box protein [Gemmatimonadota bacterium]